MADERLEDVVITITRVFDAPREQVWREFTTAESFADWFGGAASEIPMSSVTFDVTPGGRWRATMYTGPQRRESNWKGEFLEVVAPERLVLTLTDRPDDDAYALVTVVLTELDDGRTEMQFEQRGPLPPEAYEPAKAGWGKFFDRIDERLAAAG
jgi:uncharacterized protein YndB with AHSA1/START domain